MGDIIPVILCGGVGKRLWPLSREDMPKQFLNLVDPKKSLLQKTFDRALSLTGAKPSSVIIVTHESQNAIAKEQLGDYSPIILTETSARNTAPAIALAADYVSRHFSDDDIMFVLPCDGHIEDEAILQKALSAAVLEASKSKIAIFGIKPHRPETGYGYIKTGKDHGGTLTVERFVEKPDQETAIQYLNSGDYLWNSGMSVFTAQTVMEEFLTHAPQIPANIRDYSGIEPVAFDVATLEKSSRLSVIECRMEWSDIGTWAGLFEILKKNDENSTFINKYKRLGN